MTQQQTISADLAGDPRLGGLAENAAALGFEIVEISGFLEEVDRQSGAQVRAIGEVSGASQKLMAAGERMRAELESLNEITAGTRETVASSADLLRSSSRRAREIAGWVQTLAERMAQMEEALASVHDSNAEIASIAAQVNILAINAKIEAARAGSAGRGFGVVAEAINELSARTTRAAENISVRVNGLASQAGALGKETGEVARTADGVIAKATAADAAVAEIARAAEESAAHTRSLLAEQIEMSQAMSRCLPTIRVIGESAEATARGVHGVSQKVQSLVDRSESMVQASVALGGGTGDARFIERVRADAAAVGATFEAAIAAGQITEAALFASTYRPIPGTDPAQFMAPFTQLTDRLLPPIQEAALGFDPRVVFCAAVDRNGYLPTHNARFSQPQGRDPVWNAANCRNRRIFNDRVGLKAGRNTEPFLLQVYRRDMGGGNFAMMKDLSAPIFVRGHHWGGLRLAYQPT